MLFINNKYTRIYNMIIAQARTRVNDCYVERHHIIPKSLGGNNSKENLVELTAREHFICHKLLVKMTEGKDKTKMRYAVYSFMQNNPYQKRKKLTSRDYEYLRQQVALANKERPGPWKGKTLSDEHRKNLSNAKKGKKLGPKSEDHRRKISESKKGHIQSQETRKKRSNSLTGGTRSEETKLKMSLWQKGIPKPKVKCEYCNKETNLLNYKKWHGSNCKSIKERTPVPKITCNYCNKNVDVANYAQWHGNNCKYK